MIQLILQRLKAGGHALAAGLVLLSSLAVSPVRATAAAGTGPLPQPEHPAVPRALLSLSLSPSSGPVGTVVTVSGTNFTGAGLTVTLNGAPVAGATVGAGGTTLTFMVPAGATAGPVVVATAAGTETSLVPFCVQYTPSIFFTNGCPQRSFLLTATGAPAGGTYAWYSTATGGSPLFTSTMGSFNTPVLSTSTTYYLGIRTGTGATACEGPRQAVQVHVTPTTPITPVIVVRSPMPVCSGGDVTLGVSGVGNGITYFNWNNVGMVARTSSSVTLSASWTGQITVTVYNGNGCAFTSAPFVISASPTPAAPTITQPTPGTLVSSAATGNQWYLNGVAIANATGQTYSVPGAASNGSYTVTTTSAAGCSSASSAATLLGSTSAAPGTAQVTLFPNPAQGFCTVKVAGLPGPANTVDIALVNALGQIMAQQSTPLNPTTTQATVSLSGLVPGVYSCQVRAGSAVAIRRLVVE